jgi:hypothetical protein
MTPTDPPRHVGFALAAWTQAHHHLPGSVRLELFEALPDDVQDACWDDLGDRVRLWDESELLYEQRRYEEWIPKRHQPRRRSTAASSMGPRSVALSSGDPLKNIEPRVYVEALTGEVVPANGWLCCPLPDHDDTEPSFQVLSSHWRCFGCGRGGSVIDLAGALHGIEPRGRGFWRLRDLIVEALLWAPLNPEEDR